MIHMSWWGGKHHTLVSVIYWIMFVHTEIEGNSLHFFSLSEVIIYCRVQMIQDNQEEMYISNEFIYM